MDCSISDFPVHHQLPELTQTHVHSNSKPLWQNQAIQEVPESHLDAPGITFRCCSVAQSRLNLQPHGLQGTRLPCSSLSPEVCSNSRPLSQWCHPIISYSATPFSFCLKSFQAPGSFLVSWLIASHSQSTEASARASVLPTNIQGWFPLGLTGLIFLQSKGLSRVFFSTKIWRHHFFVTEPSLWSNSHIHTWLQEKP